MRFQECHQYGSIPLLPYFEMTILLDLEWPSETGYTSGGTFPIGSPKLGSRRTQNCFNPKVYSLDDQGQYIHLRSNQVKQICGLITYSKHRFESYNSGIGPPDVPFHPFSPDEWAQQSPTQMRT